MVPIATGARIHGATKPAIPAVPLLFVVPAFPDLVTALHLVAQAKARAVISEVQ